MHFIENTQNIFSCRQPKDQSRVSGGIFTASILWWRKIGRVWILLYYWNIVHPGGVFVLICKIDQSASWHGARLQAPAWWLCPGSPCWSLEMLKVNFFLLLALYSARNSLNRLPGHLSIVFVSPYFLLQSMAGLGSEGAFTCWGHRWQSLIGCECHSMDQYSRYIYCIIK